MAGREAEGRLGTELGPLVAPQQLIVRQLGKELAGPRQRPHVKRVQQSDDLEDDLLWQAEDVAADGCCGYSGVFILIIICCGQLVVILHRERNSSIDG